MNTQVQQPAFGKWRNRLWPFHSYELKKILPLVLMKFFISVIYCVLFCLKETVTVTSKGSGAEVIPVLKSVVVLPAAIIAALFYSRLSSIVKKTTLFYITLGTFLSILVAYAFILYPNAAILSPHESADWLTSIVGEKHSHWISIYRNWIHSLFFVTAELWGSVMILVVFWGFANDITTLSEAKRSYTIYIAAGDVAAAVTGPIVTWVSKKLSAFDYVFTVQCLTAFAVLVGVGIITLYFYVQKKVLSDPMYQVTTPKPVKKKEKISFSQGIKHLITSPYLLGIAILVIGDGLCISLVEVAWKANVKMAFPNPAEYGAFMGMCQSMVGTFAFIISAFLGSSMMRRLGWHITAQLTPVIVGGAGVLFLLLCSNSSVSAWACSSLGLSPLLLLVYFGAFHNVVSKVAKYSFFDPTKEMAYIPLNEDEKVKGKAAIDIVGSRLGKSGASWIQLGLFDLIGTGSVLSITHLLTPIVLAATVGWSFAVKSLNKKFSQKTADQQAEAPVTA
jgi:AAA family ATP:ADP antiporter